MSNTKGSMLISNANAVGTELVNQLGGTGYKPSEWSDAINLLGISDDDKASALAGISEGTYTGNERGSIKYSNCNAVGAMLNKKFSTNRGFKPVEWESAISKLTPLAEGTVSGSICNIVNGAEDVPLKEWSVNIPANLSGVSSIECTQAGKNLLLPHNTDGAEVTVNGIKRSYSLANQEFTFNGTNTKTDASWLIYSINASDFVLNGLKPGVTYRFSHNLPDVMYAQFTYNKSGGGVSAMGYLRGTAGRNASVSFTLPNDFISLRQLQIGVTNTATEVDVTAHFQVEVGSTATAYTPYTAPTVNTVDLGRTVYGADVDVVNGSGSEIVKKITVSSFSGTWGAVNNGYGYYISIADTTHNASFVNPIMMKANQLFTYGGLGRNTAPTWQYGGNDGGQTVHTFILPSEYDTLTKANNFLSSLETPLEVTLTLATPTDFTFNPITPTPETPLGVSNWWSEQGDSSITYRKDPDIPDPPVQLLNMNNNNEEV